MSYYEKQYALLEKVEWRLEPEDQLKRGTFEDTQTTDGGPKVGPGKSRGVYISPIVDAGQAVAWREIAWEAVLPQGAAVYVRTRFGATEEECLNGRWSARYAGSPASINLAGSRETHVAVAAARFLQVHCELVSGTAGTPTLKLIHLTAGLVAPACVGPMNRAIVTDGRPRFFWTRVEGAAGYSLEIAKNEDFGGEVAKHHGVTEPHFLPEGKLPPGTYYWRVRAIDGAKQPTPYSPARSFTVSERPQPDVSRLRHPYLFFDSSDLPRIKQSLASRHSAGMMRILEAADKALDAELWDEKETLLTPGQHSNFHPLAASVARGQLEPLTFAYLITADKRYAEKARQIMLHLAGFSRWTGVPFGDPRHFYPTWQGALETAGICKGMATAYDWLYGYLSEDDRAAVREALLRLGILPLFESWTDPRTIAYVPRHQLPAGNWWSVCNSGAGIAALALLPEVPDAVRWSQMVADAIRAYLCYPGGDMWNIDLQAGSGGQYLLHTYPNWGADGGYIESLGYVNYGLVNALYFADAFERISGEDLAPHVNPHLIDQPYYCTYSNGDGTASVINFNDSGPTNLSQDLYALLAKHTRSERARFLQDYGYPKLDSIHAILANDDSVRPELPDPSAGSKLFRDIGWSVFRSGWDTNASLMAAKFTHGRGHQDIGQFIIRYMGRSFVIDPGVTAYSSPIYSQHLRTSHAHNLVLVDDQCQMQVDGRVMGFAQAPGIGMVEADLTAAYQDMIDLWTRALIYLEPECFIVVDRLSSETARSYSWQLHPGGRMAVQPGVGVTIYQDEFEMQMRLLSPRQWRVLTKQGFTGESETEYLSFVPTEPTQHVTFIAVFVGADRGRNIGVEKQEQESLTAIRVTTPAANHTILLQAAEGPMSAWDASAEGRICAISRAKSDGQRCKWVLAGHGPLAHRDTELASADPKVGYKAGMTELR